jgi:hypothetical protein
MGAYVKNEQTQTQTQNSSKDQQQTQPTCRKKELKALKSINTKPMYYLDLLNIILSILTASVICLAILYIASKIIP